MFFTHLQRPSHVFLRATTLILLVKVASCMPLTSILPLPSNVTHIAHDAQTGKYTALWKDGSLYRRFSELEMRAIMDLEMRDPTSCTPLSVDDLQKLSGFAQIDKYFHDTYGNGHANIVTNPTEYPDRSAVLCADTKSVPVAVDGNPQCTSAKARIGGKFDGTTGLMILTFTQGYSNKGTWTVDKSTSTAIGVKFGATLTIPDIAEIGGSVTTTTTFTNSLSNSFTTQVDNTNSQQLSVNVPQGKQCYGEMDTKTCNIGGKAQIPLIASGWVWYNYDDKTSPKGSTDQHYKWAASIEGIVKNIGDREQLVSVTGNMNAESKTNYKAVCS